MTFCKELFLSSEKCKAIFKTKTIINALLCFVIMFIFIMIYICKMFLGLGEKMYRMYRLRTIMEIPHKCLCVCMCVRLDIL